MTAGRNVNSLSHDWCTPKKYADAVSELFGQVHLDPCSNQHSIIDSKIRYVLPQDGLKESWDFPTIFVNPPYGRDVQRGTGILDWLLRCHQAHYLYKSQVLALIPVATNTWHWKQYVWKEADAVCFLYDTRLKFMVDGQEGGKGAPMSCCAVYWGEDKEKFYGVFRKFGALVDLTLTKNHLWDLNW